MPTDRFQPARGSLLVMRLWPAGPLWRLTGAWLALAAVMIAGGPELGALSPLILLTALLLADVLWGGLWSQITQWPFTQGGTDRPPGLPYASASGLATRLHRAGAFVGTLIGLALVTAVTAAWIGPMALWLSAIAALLALAGLAARQAGWQPAFLWLQAALVAALPFVLGLSLAGGWPSAVPFWTLVVLVLGVTALARATLVNSAGLMPSLIVPALGAAALVVVLLVANRLFAAGVVLLLAAAPLLMLAGRLPARRPAVVAIWWWLAVLATAASLGLGLG